MIIKNGLVFQENGQFELRDIYIDEGIFVETAAGQVIDATDCYVVPGFVEIHFHGCMGYDFCDGTEDAISAMAQFQLSKGVVAMCPASMTFPEDKLEQIFKAAAAHKNGLGADLVGINMEGPFISVAKKAAQNGEFIHKPDADMFRRLQEAAGGLIKLVDIGPEVDGALQCISEIKDEVRVSLAHSAATYDQAMAGFDAGAKHVTHLFNGMNPFTHREPGILAAVNDKKDVMAELICDGVHSHPATVRMAFELLGDDRIIIISDSMMAAGLEDGAYTLGGQDVTVLNQVATITGTDTIAGGVSNILNCVKTAVNSMRVPLGSAIKAASINPAKAIGIYDEYGSISTGKRGNAVILDKSLDIKYVVKDGNIVS